MEEEDKKTKIFAGKKIRTYWNEEKEKWYFSVIDVIEILTESPRPRKYWADLKAKLITEGSELSDKIGQLKMIAEDGKLRETDVGDTEQILRLIQSIPSKKAEPFKLWLAKVGSERIDEIKNPELAQERMKTIYEKKGYSKEWIDKRLRGIAVRQDLTDEWKKRGIEEQIDFAILTNEISKATFGKTVEEYKKFKNLKDENLRDHMTDLELIFNMLGEASTAEIERVQNPQEFHEHISVSRKGGEIAKNAREELEEETGESVIVNENYLTEEERIAKEKRKKKRIILEVQ